MLAQLGLKNIKDTPFKVAISKLMEYSKNQEKPLSFCTWVLGRMLNAAYQCEDLKIESLASLLVTIHQNSTPSASLY